MGRLRGGLAVACVAAALTLAPAGGSNHLRMRVPGPHQNFPQDVSQFGEWALRTADLDTILQVYYRLPPPDAPLEGEYLAEQLEAGPELIDVVSRLAFHFPYLPGFWVGKGFMGSEGWAYNLFMEEGKLVRKYRMKAFMGTSMFDGKLCFVLDYRGQPHYLGQLALMLDEVRMVKPGLYLGLGTTGPVEATRHQPFPFLLRGPYNRLDPHEAPKTVQKEVVVGEEGQQEPPTRASVLP